MDAVNDNEQLRLCNDLRKVYDATVLTDVVTYDYMALFINRLGMPLKQTVSKQLDKSVQLAQDTMHVFMIKCTIDNYEYVYNVRAVPLHDVDGKLAIMRLTHDDMLLTTFTFTIADARDIDKESDFNMALPNIRQCCICHDDLIIPDYDDSDDDSVCGVCKAAADAYADLIADGVDPYSAKVRSGLIDPNY